MTERLAQLTALGFETADYTHPISGQEAAAEWRERWFNGPLPFATDGVVLNRLSAPACATGRHRPLSGRWPGSIRLSRR